MNVTELGIEGMAKCGCLSSSVPRDKTRGLLRYSDSVAAVYDRR